MRDWRIALEAGVNKQYGGTKQNGYESTKRLVERVGRTLYEAGFVIVPDELLTDYKELADRLGHSNHALREALLQARECCARPPGVCFDPDLIDEGLS